MNSFYKSLDGISLPVAFSPTERRQLLEDIGVLCLSVNQAFGEKTLALSQTQLPNSLIAAHSPFVRLQNFTLLIQELLPLLLALTKQPDTLLTSVSRRLPWDRLRGDAGSLFEIARSPQAQIALMRRQDPMPVLSERQARLGFETPLNRLIATLLRQLIDDAKTFVALAAFCADTNAEMQAQRLSQSLMAILSQNLWREQAPIPAPQIPLLLAQFRAKVSLPARLILGKWERYRTETMGFDWSGVAALTLTERAEWQLYEIWCFLQLANALQSLGWSPVGEEQIRLVADGLHLVLATGRASCLTFLPPNSARKVKRVPLRLFYQPLFVSANRQVAADTTGEDSERYVSRSHAMQPDFVIDWRGRLVIFDAKLRSYSTFGAEQDDIDKMHAYRDGIVRRAGQNVRAAVSAAWCLFPGVLARGNREQGTENSAFYFGIRAYPAPTESAPFGNGDIGAIRLRPGNTSLQPHLRDLLQTLIG